MTDLRATRTIQKSSKGLKLHVIAAYLTVLVGLSGVLLACAGPLFPEKSNELLEFAPWTFEDGIVQTEILILGGAVLCVGIFYRSILAFLVWWHHG